MYWAMSARARSRIRGVFGGYSGRLRALRHVPLVLAGLLIAARGMWILQFRFLTA